MKQLPISWSDINISAYHRLLAIDTEDTQLRTTATIGALLNKTIKQVNKMTPKEYKEAVTSLEFVNKLPSQLVTSKFTLRGIEFGIIPNLNHITMNEFVDLETYTANWKENIHKIIAVLYRPIIKEDEISYEIEEYNSLRSSVTSEWFLHELSIEIAYAASIFFSVIGSLSWISTMKSSMEMK